MSETLTAFNTVFFSIILQAFPFLLLGAMLSSVLHIFVSDNFIVKLFPKRWGLGFITALFAGFFFPVCECATIPVLRQLIKKGVPIPIAVTFMLAAPIVNPISIFATIYAFPQMPMVAFYRVYFGITTAFIIGLLLLFYPEKNILLQTDENNYEHHHDHKGDEHNCSCNCEHNHSLKEKFIHLFLHTADEFFSVGKFLIIGAILASFIRVITPENLFSNVTSNGIVALLIQMFFAFIFSACSTSDAFIARSFLNRFSLNSIMGFLVYGPMMDIKNLFMLLSFFKKRFVIELAILITIINILSVSALTQIFL